MIGAPQLSLGWPLSGKQSRIVGIAHIVAYAVTGALVLWVQKDLNGPSLWYPPVALARTLLIACGLRMWPLVLLLDSTITYFQFGDGLLRALSGGVATTVEAVLTTWLLRRRKWSLPVITPRGIWELAVYGAVLPSLVGSAIGTAVYFQVPGPQGESVLNVFATWCIGDMASTMVLMPWLTWLILPTVTKTDSEVKSKKLEAFLYLSFALIAAIAGFSHLRFVLSQPMMRLLLLVIAFLCAYRLGPRFTSLLTTITATAGAIIAMQAGVPSMIQPNGTAYNLLDVQVYLAVLVLGSSMLALAVESERTTKIAQLATQEDLDSVQTRLARLVDANVVGVFYWDQKGRIQQANRAFTELVGDARLGTIPWWRMVAKADPGASSLARELRAWGAAQPRQIEWVNSSGKTCIALTGAATLSKGRWRGIGITADVTERHKMQEVLQRSVRMEGLGRLAAGVAHDFNNVLQVIISYCDMVEADCGPNRSILASLNQMRNAAGGGAAMTRRLLAMGRKAPAEMALTDANELVRGFTTFLRRLVRENVQIKVMTEATVPTVWVDVSQMEQVLMNLAINAADAMPKGGRLTLRTYNFLGTPANLADGHWLAIEVTDTGHGMDPQTAARAFDPYFTTKSEEQGTGLGLDNVRRLVQDVGGDVALESRVGEGTSITLYVPTHKGGKAQPITGEQKPKSRTWTAGGTVLLVEDNPDILRLLARSLGRAGYRVITAADGDEGRDRIQNWRGNLDVLVSDVMMPGSDGRDLARLVRSQFPDAVVILMTGYMDQVVEKPTAGLADTILSKPFSNDELLTEISHALEERSRRQQS